MNPLVQSQSLMAKFTEFQKMMAGKNPNEIIENMVKSGQVSQAELDAAIEKAKQLSQFISLR